MARAPKSGGARAPIVRLAELARALRSFAVELQTPPGGGSHYRFHKAGFPRYPVPAHRGMKTEIPRIYFAGVAANFELTEQEIRERL